MNAPDDKSSVGFLKKQQASTSNFIFGSDYRDKLVDALS